MKNASELSNKPEKDPQESNNLLQSIIGEITDTIFVKDISGRYIVMNSAGANILEKSIEEIIGKDDTQLFPHNVAHKLMEEDQKIIASGREIAFDDEVSINGKILNFHTVKVPYRNYRGNIIGVIGIARDITERKKYEKELLKMQELESLESSLQKLNEELVQVNYGTEEQGKEKGVFEQPYGNLSSINTSRVILDSVGEDVLRDIVNEYLCLLGTSSAIYEKNGDYALGIFASGWCRLLDKSSRDLCNTKDNTKALDSKKWLCHESCLSDASKVSMETNNPVDIECHGGLRLYAIPILAGNEIVGSINFGYGNPPIDPQKIQEIADKYNLDIDELREQAGLYVPRPDFVIEMAKNRLHTSARLIGALVHSKKTEKEIKWLAKFPSENPNPVMRVFNDGNILYNNKASSFLLDYWGCQSTRILPEKYIKIISEALNSGLDNVTEVESKDRIMSLTFAPIVEEGYVNVYGLDITERKKMEEALIQSEKLKSIGTLTAGISHEFNNILAIISGNVQLLKETFNYQEGLTDILRTISKAVNDGAEISKNMLKFTNTKQDTKKFVPSDLISLIMQSIEFTMPRWKSMAQVKGISYQIDKEGMKEIPFIMCNPTEIREIFINIINNALDAMPDGGSISFSTWGGDETVFVNITDTGVGMSEDVKKNIFDPFFSTRMPVGTGLGMSISYGIVARHGGKIDVESKVGKGSAFSLQFPSTIKTVSPIATPKPEQETTGKNLSILVVDDEEEICNMLDDYLSKRGNKVKAVDKGADAIELINSEHFDLVLCDIAMPNVSGYDVIKVLNKLEKRPKTGIITGWGERVKPTDEEGIKVDFVLKKPFDLSVLIKHINEVFGDA